MASSGTIINDFRTGYRVQIAWKVNSQNIANNTSNVTAKVQLVSTGGYYSISASATKNGSLTINGNTYNFTFSAALSANQTKTVYTKTLDISHNSDGSKTVSMSASLAINVTLSGVYWGTVKASGNGTLNNIPRTSSISLSSGSVNFGNTITVNINRASSSFTHKVHYVFGNRTITFATDAGTSASYSIPLDHMNDIPNATSGAASIYVDTYNGSTYIGTAGANFTINVPGNIVPSISGLSASLVPDGAPSSYGYVKGKSKCTLSINGASGSYGSSIRSYSISGGGFSTTSNSFTTGVLNNAGNITFTAYVTDSRGRTSAAKTVSINVNDYFAPYIVYPIVYRCDSSGNRNDDGTYIKVHFEYQCAEIVVFDVSHKIEYKSTSSGTWIDAGSVTSERGLIIGGGNISTSNSYNVRITLSDTISTISQTYTIPTAYAILDIKKGGKAISIGKAAETDNLFDISMDTMIDGYMRPKKGLTIHDAYGTAGQTGYVNIAQFEIRSAYMNQPIYLMVTQRRKTEVATLQITFQATNDEDPPLDTFYKTGDIYAYIYKSSLGVWDLYISKSEGYDRIEILDFKKGRYMDQVQVQWKNVMATSVPSGYIEATRKPVDDHSHSYISANGGTLNGPINVSGESTFYNGSYSDPAEGVACAIKAAGHIATSGSFYTRDWFRSFGNTGWYNQTYGGGWYMIDSTWLRAYGNKSIYTGGTIRTDGQVECNSICNANSAGNLDLNTLGKSFSIQTGSASGVWLEFRPYYSGSQGTEPTFKNGTGNGWGYVGGSDMPFFRVYGAGGSVSNREKKYDITKANVEEQYENIKALNIYNYRSVSDKKDEETGEILETCKRQDLMLGCMVDELPLETIFYDNEDGDGKAVDMYSYTTMILGATKHLQQKVEMLEKENEELKLRLDRLEEMISGITNGE